MPLPFKYAIFSSSENVIMAEILEIIPEIDSPENHIKMEDADDWNCILNILNTGTDSKINSGNIYKGDTFAPEQRNRKSSSHGH